VLWGIDLGGTKIEGVILDPAQPDRPVLRQRIPTGSERGYDHVVERVRLLVERMEDASRMRRPAALGIGTPGAVEPATGLMKNCNTVCLNGRPLPHDLSVALGADVKVANDANCFALAEATFGAGRGRAVVVGLIIGTGVGSGIVVHGRALEGIHGIAGEWGHNPLCGEDAPCYCGRRGCIETVLSGPGLSADHQRRGGAAMASEALVALAAAGDPRAGQTMAVWTRRVAKSLAAVINLLDPDVIVVGGGLSRIASLYTDVPAIWAEWIFSDRVATRLVPARYGDASGVRGAARLWG
jgi:predicted NBD/HSP70 family sugar kinase